MVTIIAIEEQPGGAALCGVVVSPVNVIRSLEKSSMSDDKEAIGRLALQSRLS